MNVPATLADTARAIRAAVLAEDNPIKRAKMTRLSLAIDRAPRVYPPAVGKLIASELTAYLNMSWRWAQGSLCEQLVDDVLSRPVPPPEPPRRTA